MNRANSERAAGGTGAAESAAPTDAAGDTDVGEELAKDDLFHVLQNQRRRRILAFLRDATGTVEMGDVAEQIAAWENDKPVGAITSEERQRAYIALYQSHLPKLDGIGVVEYDQNRGTVERTPLADRFDPYLDVDRPTAGEAESPDDDPTPTRDGRSVALRYYGAATLLGGVLTAASAAGLLPATSPGSLAALVTGLFVLVTLAVAYERRR